MFNMDLIKRDTVQAMIQEVKTAQTEVNQAFALLQQAKTRLASTLGEYRDRIFPNHITDYSLCDDAESSYSFIERNAWASVVERLQVREIISIKKRDALDRQLGKEKLPPLTTENVFAFMNQLFNDMGSLLEDSAREVFDWLRPSWRTELKTNRKNTFGLTNKVICTYMMQPGWGNTTSQVSYYKDKYLQAMDNVFHLLDGKGVAKHPNDLKTVIDTAGRNGQWSCSTEYFHCKWYKNNNLHIEFRRMDLVRQLNKLAGSDKLAA